MVGAGVRPPPFHCYGRVRIIGHLVPRNTCYGFLLRSRGKHGISTCFQKAIWGRHTRQRSRPPGKAAA